MRKRRGKREREGEFLILIYSTINSKSFPDKKRKGRTYGGRTEVEGDVREGERGKKRKRRGRTGKVMMIGEED